ncbi:MAG: murein hydrolase activator EnvC [Rhizobiaceae bacterium]|nr:murein hydrolase activator EnvC [Rhizobiaceae bacterium]
MLTPTRLRIAAAAVAAGAMLSPLALRAEDRLPVAPQASQAEYEQVSRDITLSADRMAKLAADIATIRKDQATLTAAMIQSAKTEKKLAEDIEDIAGRLAVLRDQEAVLQASLEARRSVLAEVLGALQRMGLNPPPAIFVKPEDALSSVRSAILLGAVVPELRSQTEILLGDLREKSRIASSIEGERQRLAKAVEDQLQEKRRLELLVDEKRRLQGETEVALVAERKRSEELAAKAQSLKELIASLEAEADKKRRQDEVERDAADEKARRDAEMASLPVPEANRLTGPLPFEALRGQVFLPVAGRTKLRFGGSDGNGGVMHGDMVATQSGAIVTAPADGSVLYAGPFRSYGQLLILNAGDGYHVVLAGMSRISVAQGQSVLAGEPVGAMGEARLASSGTPEDDAAVELYVEFRKDGQPVDPSPWWADRQSGRT